MSAVVVQEVINVAYTNATFTGSGVTLASITATITGTAVGNTTPVTVSVTANAPSITVPLIPDTYNWTLVNLGSDGNTYGGPFAGSGVVHAPATFTLALASGLSFT